MDGPRILDEEAERRVEIAPDAIDGRVVDRHLERRAVLVLLKQIAVDRGRGHRMAPLILEAGSERVTSSDIGELRSRVLQFGNEDRISVAGIPLRAEHRVRLLDRVRCDERLIQRAKRVVVDRIAGLDQHPIAERRGPLDLTDVRRERRRPHRPARGIAHRGIEPRRGVDVRSKPRHPVIEDG